MLNRQGRPFPNLCCVDGSKSHNFPIPSPQTRGWGQHFERDQLRVVEVDRVRKVLDLFELLLRIGIFLIRIYCVVSPESFILAQFALSIFWRTLTGRLKELDSPSQRALACSRIGSL